MKKKRVRKLALNRETLKVLHDDPAAAVAAAALVGPGVGGVVQKPIGFPTWPTCQNSGCYICSGATCTMGCGSCGDAF